MQNFLDKYPLAFIPLFLLFWCAISYLIAAIGGWMTLARRFRLTSTFTGPTWGFQSARMRWRTNYGGSLRIGADVVGLYLATLFLFRVGHPPLLIPWSEVSVANRNKFLFMRQVELRFGREEQIPFVIRGGLADCIQAAAGASWPVEV